MHACQECGLEHGDDPIVDVGGGDAAVEIARINANRDVKVETLRMEAADADRLTRVEETVARIETTIARLVEPLPGEEGGGEVTPEVVVIEAAPAEEVAPESEMVEELPEEAEAPEEAAPKEAAPKKRRGWFD